MEFLNVFTAYCVDTQDEWENNTLERFVEALSASVNDISGAYTIQSIPLELVNPWQIFADALFMATDYE